MRCLGDSQVINVKPEVVVPCSGKGSTEGKEGGETRQVERNSSARQL